MEYVPSFRPLQDTLAASSATPGLPVAVPHHPITCGGQLAYDETGGLSCPHTAVSGDDPRTIFAVQQSVAILLLEEAERLLGTPWLKVNRSAGAPA